jgi:hypothetical protein
VIVDFFLVLWLVAVAERVVGVPAGLVALGSLVVATFSVGFAWWSHRSGRRISERAAVAAERSAAAASASADAAREAARVGN